MAGHASAEWKAASPAYRFLSATARAPVKRLSRLRVRGIENVPPAGPVLVASNHLSWADPILINDAIPRPTYWLAKSTIFENPAGAQAMKAFGCIKVDREAKGNEGAVQAAVGALAEGKVVGVFPEGTRSFRPEVREGRTGVARIAALSGAPILPIGIDTSALWPRGALAPRLGRRSYLAIGAPFTLDLKPADAADRDKLRDATAEVMRAVRALFETARDARARKEAWP